MKRSSLYAVPLIVGAAATLAAAASFHTVELPAVPLSTVAAPLQSTWNGPAAAGALPQATNLPSLAAPAVTAAVPVSGPAAAPAAASRLNAEVSASAAKPEAAGESSGPSAAPKSAESGVSDGAARFDGALPMPESDKLEKVDPLDLAPMQIPVGMREVQEKERKLRSLDEKGRKKWLQEKAVPYVVRDGKKRPIDHHHETRAAWQAGMDHVYAYSAVDKKEQKRLDGLSDAEFWKEMKARGWFYDKDQFGEGPRAPEQLPEDTRGHADDPFRSVAGEVRKRGGYDKSPTPFAEFAWANFFRTRVKTYPRGDADYEKAVKEALALAKSEGAKGLPGYNGPR